MADTILVLIKSNPLESHRPVEAIRIALGLVSGEHPVSIVLLNRSPLLLSDDTEDLVDGDILQKYLPAFEELGQTFMVEENALQAHLPEGSEYAIQAVSFDKIADLVQGAGRFFIF
ncbi:MAG TPA: hypothetical protein VMN77_04990 [Nitrospiria bacterium]|jgi:hypothetical protein|nr:hypothetical protein [Nitrospiria bacterium]